VDVAVVGGGVAGLLTALHLTSLSAAVFEQRRSVGSYRHCTGVISPETASRIGVPKDLVEGVYRRLLLIARGSSTLFESRGGVLALRVDREGLEGFIAQQLLSRGHSISTSARVLGVDPVGCVLTVARRGSVKRVRARYIVVAEGYSQAVARRAGLLSVSDRLFGLQAFYRCGRGVDEETLYVFAGDPFRDGYGWLVPTERGLLVGALSREPWRSLSTFASLLRRAGVITDRLTPLFGGVALRGYPVRVRYGCVLGVGDSVAMVKSFSSGGLYAISLAAPVLAKSLELGAPWRYSTWVLKSLAPRLRLQYLAAKLLYTARASPLSRLLPMLGSRVAVYPGEYDDHVRLVVRALASASSS